MLKYDTLKEKGKRTKKKVPQAHPTLGVKWALRHLVIFGLKNTLQVSFCLGNKYCPQSLVHFSIRFLKIR